MINKVITTIDIVNDEYKGQYAYRFTRAIATLSNHTRLQLHAELYCGAEGKLSGRWIKRRISAFIQSKKKAFQDYCHGKNKEHDPLSFMNWIDTQNYHYEHFSSVSKLKGCNVWEYHGNLREYSSAFSFYIFDKTLASKCRRHIHERH